jgi:hypothetical protein
MRLSKRKIAKSSMRVICEKWERVFEELEAYRKIAKVQKTYYALLPYRPEKEPEMYRDIDIRLTVSDGVFVHFD